MKSQPENDFKGTAQAQRPLPRPSASLEALANRSERLGQDPSAESLGPHASLWLVWLLMEDEGDLVSPDRGAGQTVLP